MHLIGHSFDHVLAIQVHEGRDGWVLSELPLQKVEGLDVLPTLLQRLHGQEDKQ